MIDTPPTTPQAGDPAPDVALPDETGTVHRLADQRGRWTVLYFYPEDDTPGCTTEACQFRDMNEQYADTGADVWGVSPDGSASHRRFREKFDLPFTLLSIPTTTSRRGMAPGARRPTTAGRAWGSAGR